MMFILASLGNSCTCAHWCNLPTSNLHTHQVCIYVYVHRHSVFRNIDKLATQRLNKCVGWESNWRIPAYNVYIDILRKSVKRITLVQVANFQITKAPSVNICLCQQVSGLQKKRQNQDAKIKQMC